MSGWPVSTKSLLTFLVAYYRTNASNMVSDIDFGIQNWTSMSWGSESLDSMSRLLKYPELHIIFLWIIYLWMTNIILICNYACIIRLNMLLVVNLFFNITEENVIWHLLCILWVGFDLKLMLWFKFIYHRNNFFHDDRLFFSFVLLLNVKCIGTDNIQQTVSLL